MITINENEMKKEKGRKYVLYSLYGNMEDKILRAGKQKKTKKKKIYNQFPDDSDMVYLISLSLFSSFAGNSLGEICMKNKKKAAFAKSITRKKKLIIPISYLKW